MTNDNFWQLMCDFQTDINEKNKILIGIAIDRIKNLQGAINLTLKENGNLADGDDCTLIHLKKVMGVE